MNLIGHNYIAYKTLGHVSPDIILGSHIPDIVPFLPSTVFTFEEIHEDCDGLLEFISKSYPNNKDLPLSMMCHSVKFGVDEYNRKIDEWLLNNNTYLTHKISKMIARASGVDYETAKGPRLHNYLWCGIDLYILINNPDSITNKLSNSFNEIDLKKAAVILSSYYQKDRGQVESNLVKHFETITSSTFNNLPDYMKFWKSLLSNLKEGDNLDVDKGTELLNYIYKAFEAQWPEILSRTSSLVLNKMRGFI